MLEYAACTVNAIVHWQEFERALPQLEKEAIRIDIHSVEEAQP